MPIKVKLDINANPPVTVTPNPFPVNRGKAPIKWQRDDNQQFKFVNVDGLPTHTFSNKQKKNNDTEFEMDDDNQGAQSYSYKVVVDLNGKQYSTDRSSTSPSADAQPKLAAAAGTLQVAGPIIQNK